MHQTLGRLMTRHIVPSPPQQIRFGGLLHDEEAAGGQEDGATVASAAAKQQEKGEEDKEVSPVHACMHHVCIVNVYGGG